MYVRMVIGEAVSAEQVHELVRLAKTAFEQMDETEVEQPEYLVMVEDGGNMVVIETRFKTRDHCLKFHSSRVYRLFVQATQHLLVGNYVVKMFMEG